MGREQRRKESKKIKAGIPKANQQPETPESELIKLLKTLGVIIAVILFIYLLTALVITKEIKLFDTNKENKVENNTNSTSNAILAKSTFNQSEASYYVYFYDFSNQNKLIESSLTGLSDKVYRVNTKDAFNSNYISPTGNPSATNLDDLKVTDLTLIKIENGSITSYNEGKDNIISQINK